MQNSRNRRLAELTFDTKRGYVRFSTMPRAHLALVESGLRAHLESGSIRLVQCALSSDHNNVAGAYYVNPASVEIENLIRKALGKFCCG